MNGRRAILASVFAAVSSAGCHGATIREATPDGGAGGARGGAGASAGTTGTGGGAGASAGTTGTGGGAGASAGTTGTGGTGGATGRGGGGGVAGGLGGRGGGGGNGGTGGAGCAAQMTPSMFYRGELPPLWSEGTSHRYYWAEATSPYLTVHYAPGDTPMETLHPFQIDASLANSYFDLAASDVFVGGIWYLDGRLGFWGPDVDSMQIGMKTLTNPGAIAIAGGTVYYSLDPMGGNPTPGIYQWAPPGGPSLFASYPALGGTRTLGLLLRVSGSKLLLCDRFDVYMVDRAAPGTAQPLFVNPSNAVITDVRPARPHALDAGVIVMADDATYYETGRDYYADITQPANPPTDLSIATTMLADRSACGAAAHYNGAGVLFNRRYIYEGDQGLFAVDVAANGAVSNLVRLTDGPFRYIDVTGDGDLFAGKLYSSKWDYYRIGRVGS